MYKKISYTKEKYYSLLKRQEEEENGTVSPIFTKNRNSWLVEVEGDVSGLKITPLYFKSQQRHRDLSGLSYNPFSDPFLLKWPNPKTRYDSYSKRPSVK